MRRLIVDTNLWISALLKAPFRQRLETVLFHSDVQLLISPALLDEFTRVAVRDKFRKYFTVEQALQLLELVRELAVSIQPHSEVKASPDPDDNFLLALALDGHADVLLSGNKKDLLDLKVFGATRILTLTGFLAELD